MPKRVKIETVYDPGTKRYSAKCPIEGCERIFVRSTSGSAIWNLSQHVTHNHDAETYVEAELPEKEGSR